MPAAEPVLLVVAPSMFLAHKVAQQWGIDPVLACGLRTVTKPQMLRGWSRGTPFIAAFREEWGGISENGKLLDMVLDLRQRQGAVRMAQDDDLKRVKGEG